MHVTRPFKSGPVRPGRERKMKHIKPTHVNIEVGIFMSKNPQES